MLVIWRRWNVASYPLKIFISSFLQHFASQGLEGWLLFTTVCQMFRFLPPVACVTDSIKPSRLWCFFLTKHWVTISSSHTHTLKRIRKLLFYIMSIVLFLRYLMWLAVANLLVCVVLLPFTLHSHATPVPYAAALYFAHIEVSARRLSQLPQ